MHVVHPRPRKSKIGSRPLVLLEAPYGGKKAFDGPTSAGVPSAGSIFNAMRGVRFWKSMMGFWDRRKIPQV